MTNPLPNDLSHLSEEEFNSLCPQGEHAPGPEPLSLAAQAVLNAALETDFEIDLTNLDATLKASMKTVAAAALRAAVHWLAYETQLDDPMMTTTHVVDADRLDAIAAELEALPNG
jgi:hypothetical protein